MTIVNHINHTTELSNDTQCWRAWEIDRDGNMTSIHHVLQQWCLVKT